MASLIERQADRLSARSSRRGFMRVAAKVTAAVAGVGVGFSRFYNQAAASSHACCTLAFGLCSTCPNCPSNTYQIYGWACCYGGCIWTCKECYFNAQYSSGCSCAYNNYANCAGQICNYGSEERAAR